jgi:hypothetical protein
MDRRAFISGITVGLLTAPLAAAGQPAGKVYRVGLLGEKASDSSEARLWQVFRLESSWLGGSWSHIPAPERETGR